MQVDRTRMYRVSAVAKALDVSKSTVYRAIESGALDALRVGSTLRVPGTALATWLHDCAQAAAGGPVADVDQADGVLHAEPVGVAAR